MEKHLQETYGIMVYQEQVLKIANDMAGFSMSEADDLRKAMGKKIAALMAEQRAKFLAGAKGRGVKEKVAERVFELMEKFAGYGFNKAHATAYGIVAYQTAYFKANYPVEFMAALLTSEMANTDKVVVHMDECRAMGIGVLPPDVNVSRFSFGVDGETIRFGLGAIKNLGQKAIEIIVASREEQGAFASLVDFCRRLDLQLVNRRVVESLVKAGAFDSSARPRAQLMAALDDAFDAGQRHQRERDQNQVSMFDLLGSTAEGGAVEPDPLDPSIAEWDSEQRLLNEKEVLGFYLSGHPLRGVWDRAQRLGVVGTGQLGPGRGRRERPPLRAGVGAPRDQHEERQPHGLRDHRGRRGHDRGHDLPGAVPAERGAPPKSGSPLLVRGKVEGTSTARKLLADDVRPLPAETEERAGRHPVAARLPRGRPPGRGGGPAPGPPGDLRGSPRNGAPGHPPPRGRNRGRRPLPHPARAPVGGLRRGRGGAPRSG